MLNKRDRLIKWAKIGAVVGIGIAILQMFTVFGAANAPVARTLGRLIGGAVIFGAIGERQSSIENQNINHRPFLSYFQNIVSCNLILALAALVSGSFFAGFVS
jgi:hypothetical protein